MSVMAFALDGFGLDRLRLVDWPRDEMLPGHVRIAVEAVSLNRRDVLVVEGSYAPRLRMPAIPCSDAAGRVIEAAPGSQHRVGDRVVAHMFPKWLGGKPSTATLRSGLGGIGAQGTLRTDMVLPGECLVPIPEHLSAQEAATLPCAALTAWSAVVKFGETGPDSRVLVQGTGGVSLFALQFAKARGAFVVATTSRPENADRLRALGADAVFNYKDAGWADEARKLTEEGFDLIIEVAGGADLDGSLRLIRPGGMIAVIGVLAGVKASLTLPLVLMRQVSLQGVTCGSLTDFQNMVSDIAALELRPVISEVFPFGRALQALEAMRANAFFGKIVIDVASGT